MSNLAIQAGFQKQAKLKLEHIEDSLGQYLSGEWGTRASELIDEQNKSKLGLKYPILSSIFTLGILPSEAKFKATKEVRRQLLREFPDLRQKIDDSLAKSIEERMRLQREKEEHERRMALIDQQIKTQKIKKNEGIMSIGTSALLQTFLANSAGIPDIIKSKKKAN